MMRMSKGFAAIWAANKPDKVLSELEMQPRLQAVIHAPFVRRAGVLLLGPLAANASALESFQDATGYEAFINKIHLGDLVESSAQGPLRILVQQGMKAAVELAERLRKEGEYRVLLSLDTELPTATLRFFRRRKGEPWGAEDPDAFTLEDVLMIDTAPHE